MPTGASLDFSMSARDLSHQIERGHIQVHPDNTISKWQQNFTPAQFAKDTLKQCSKGTLPAEKHSLRLKFYHQSQTA